MTFGTVVLLGNLSGERAKLDSIAAEFGCSLRGAAGFTQLRDLSLDERVLAVFLDAGSLHLSWVEALESVLNAASMALPIVCHNFSERFHWPTLVEAGAFHALPLPLDPDELRQSLGFVVASKGRRSVNGAPLRLVERARSRTLTAGSAA